tara:strand:+ start:1654 stop:3135 length:1482 start_codon:yes stop_codon:yes gene_type:complete
MSNGIAPQSIARIKTSDRARDRKRVSDLAQADYIFNRDLKEDIFEINKAMSETERNLKDNDMLYSIGATIIGGLLATLVPGGGIFANEMIRRLTQAAIVGATSYGAETLRQKNLGATDPLKKVEAEHGKKAIGSQLFDTIQDIHDMQKSGAATKGITSSLFSFFMPGGAEKVGAKDVPTTTMKDVLEKQGITDFKDIFVPEGMSLDEVLAQPMGMNPLDMSFGDFLKQQGYSPDEISTMVQDFLPEDFAQRGLSIGPSDASGPWTYDVLETPMSDFISNDTGLNIPGYTDWEGKVFDQVDLGGKAFDDFLLDMAEPLANIDPSTGQLFDPQTYIDAGEEPTSDPDFVGSLKSDVMAYEPNNPNANADGMVPEHLQGLTYKVPEKAPLPTKEAYSDYWGALEGYEQPMKTIDAHWKWNPIKPGKTLDALLKHTTGLDLGLSKGSYEGAWPQAGLFGARTIAPDVISNLITPDWGTDIRLPQYTPPVYNNPYRRR